MPATEPLFPGLPVPTTWLLAETTQGDDQRDHVLFDTGEAIHPIDAEAIRDSKLGMMDMRKFALDAYGVDLKVGNPLMAIYEAGLYSIERQMKHLLAGMELTNFRVKDNAVHFDLVLPKPIEFITMDFIVDGPKCTCDDHVDSPCPKCFPEKTAAWDARVTDIEFDLFRGNADFTKFTPPAMAICECGARKTGVKLFEPGHADWCAQFHGRKP